MVIIIYVVVHGNIIKMKVVHHLNLLQQNSSPGAREEEVEAIWLEEKALHQEFKDAGKEEARDMLALTS